MDTEHPGRPDRALPGAGVAVGGGAAVGVISLVAAVLHGAPYLSLSSLNPWIGVFAVAAFVALFAVPFAVNSRLVARSPERTEAWERSMLAWGGVALAVLVPAGLLIWATDSTPSASLLCAAATVLAIEAGLILAALLVWVLSS